MKIARIALVLIPLLQIGRLSAQTPAQTDAYVPSAGNLQQRAKFQDAKFGMFIHWGIYSELGAGEWVMNQKKIPYDTYSRLARSFYPADFNAKEWVQIAKNAGMKYITITTRHHDGFSMFKTKASPYNIVDATPFHRDPIKELADECAKQGIGIRFYYSLLDWGRADYGWQKPLVEADWNHYIDFMKTQLTELITNYPNVEGIWFDGFWDRPTANWRYDEICALIHKLNPKIMIGNNHHQTPKNGEDFQMFERDLPGENKGGFSAGAKIGALPLETCETMNGSWGFTITDTKYKTVKQVIHYLANAAGRNANLLLNVGPMASGTIQPEFTDTLAAVGKWLAKNGEAIYGTRGGIVAPQKWGVVTKKDKVIYVHVLDDPAQPDILIPGMNEKIARIETLNSKTKLNYKQQADGLNISLANAPVDPYDTILKITLL